MQKSFGLNLGGWLIPEKWMTPSLFEGITGDDLHSLLKTDVGRKKYQEHIRSFITEADFIWMNEHGISMIRLPIGYWTHEGQDGFIETKHRLDWAFEMAKKYEILILLDLHAVKGSQNGTVHSGQIGRIRWLNHIDETVDYLKLLAQEYGAHFALWGIELVNEPKMGGDYFKILRLYRRVYSELVAILPKDKAIIFHDAFHPILFAGSIRSTSGHPIYMDMHLYLVPGKWKSLSRYLKFRDFYYRILLFVIGRFQPVIVGEWSSVLPQPIFDHTVKSDHEKMLLKNIHNQKRLFQGVYYTFYWNYKAEKGGMWNYKALSESDKLL